ncbi:SH2 domain-containing protein 4A [Cololabis saira]|uniref:SH2 domain-containing protein 4A n=1 Tax=Cololabis saira TaxID=129043 RepID=UPI002AD524F8|nr:SH2 domain-containing protein 4A [Cololabis saira]XP_061581835.1 SH2 domain-containing protein 4A [Cololabis saira]
MLAKILEDMWVDPEVLEALGEEQKRILFLKMREEQVRRWREREDREETEGQNRKTRAKKASSKHVSWLLGRDGDVSVSIIGEVDELRASKVLQSLMNNRLHTGTMNGIQTVDLLPGKETQPLGFKDDIKLPLTHVNEDSASPDGRLSGEDWDSSGADDDLKDPAEDSGSESGGSDSVSDWDPRYRPRLGNHGNRSLKAQLSDTERVSAQDREAPCCRGPVVHLGKALTDHPQGRSPAVNKPPIPVKPAHLQRQSSPMNH